ncbi:hypothetical protein PV326_005547 [Microctonus aethiopoides]|nr:hypothetical protein PV326_005547 [Microctonus aethiopoides]
MKNKWRHIRDNFLKSLNRGKSGDPAAKTRKYIYADALQFLLNTVEKRRTSGNIEATENPETGAPSGDRIDEEGEQPPSTSSGSELPPPPRPASRQRQDRFTPFQSALLQKLDWTNADQDNEDPDRIYILSLLSDYKKLNDDEKMDFKFPSSFPIQGPYQTPSPTLMQPPSPMHQSSPSPSLFPMQRPCPTPTPSPNSIQPPSPIHQSSPSPSHHPMQRSHPVPSPYPSSMQSQPTIETTQHSFYDESSESSASMESHYHY